jgi:hypothetical protein
LQLLCPPEAILSGADLAAADYYLVAAKLPVRDKFAAQNLALVRVKIATEKDVGRAGCAVSFQVSKARPGPPDHWMNYCSGTTMTLVAPGIGTGEPGASE